MPKQEQWDSWTDMLGNELKPGCSVIYARLERDHALLVYGRLVRINKTNSKNEPITETVYNPKTKQNEDKPSCTLTVVPGYKEHSARMITIQKWRNVVLAADEAIREKIRLEEESLERQVNEIKARYDA